MNRYNYNSNRKRSYNNRNNGGTSIAGFIVALIGITIVLGIWVLSLKSDIRHLKSDIRQLSDDKTETKHKMDSIVNTLQPPKKEVFVEKKSKTLSNKRNDKVSKSEKDTVVKAKQVKTEIIVDTTGL
jgi:predicted Holliday junction resolvase-like endonuclease